MTELLITRGLPGCGKTTFARKWVEEDRAHRARVNRDDIRQMVDEGLYVQNITEPRIVVARNAMILRLLKAGVSVINDDTNLPQRVARDLAKLAQQAGADFQVHDMTNVPLEIALEQNNYRQDKDPLDESVILDMYNRFVKGGRYPMPEVVLDGPESDATALTPYVAVEGTPKAILVDIDGTAALKGARSPFDETRVHEDRPNERVIEQVQVYYAAGYRVIFMSGRTEGCRDATEEWLEKNVKVYYDDLFMRPSGDGRKDSVVKAELFDTHVRPYYDVRAVLDDRNQVVDMWRSLGLFCAQVAPGNF